jgi:hypothetical protein
VKKVKLSEKSKGRSVDKIGFDAVAGKVTFHSSLFCLIAAFLNAVSGPDLAGASGSVTSFLARREEIDGKSRFSIA